MTVQLSLLGEFEIQIFEKADELVGNFSLVDSVREWHNGRFYCPIHSNRVEIMKGQTPLIKLINIHIKDLPVVNSPKKS